MWDLIDSELGKLVSVKALADEQQQGLIADLAST
jgi:hypothetical protein